MIQDHRIKLHEMVFHKVNGKGSIYLMDASTDDMEVFELEGAARDVFPLIRKGASKNEMMSYLMNEYEDVEAVELEKDLEEFLAALNGLKMLE